MKKSSDKSSEELNSESELEEVIHHNLNHLNKTQQIIVNHIAVTMLPPGGILKLSVREAQVVQFVDYFLSHFPPLARNLIGIFFYIVEIAPFLFIFKFKRFTQLQIKDKTRYLMVWENNRFYWIRMGFTLLKMMISFGYCSHPEVKKRMGYFEPCNDIKKLAD